MTVVRERLSNGTHAFEVMASDLPNGVEINDYRRVRGRHSAHPNETLQAMADALELDPAIVLLALFHVESMEEARNG